MTWSVWAKNAHTEDMTVAEKILRLPVLIELLFVESIKMNRNNCTHGILRLPETSERFFVDEKCLNIIIRKMEILRLPWFIGMLCVYEKL